MGYKPEDKITAPIQDILRIVHDLKEATAVSHSTNLSPVTHSAYTMITSINLPGPRPLLPLLLEAGLSHAIAGSISETYELRAEELKRRVQESVLTTCREIAEHPTVALAVPSGMLTRKLVSVFTELYLHRLEQWKAEIAQRVKQVPKVTTKTAPKICRNFNQEYVPLLEHFFEENPFPTHADKVFLAKKSDMEYKQIHVWFQNRRNRTKKEGKMLRKKPTHERGTKPLDKLYQRMKDHMVHYDSQALKPSQPTSPEETTKTDFTQHNVLKDGFVSASPPHAFPSLYPPACHYDPFPCKSGSADFNKPKWRRVPDRKQLPPVSTSIDDLVERFSHLNVRDEIRSKAFQLQPNAATAAITVIPSRAPHPSLIVRKNCQPTITIQCHPSVRPHVCRSDVFQSFGSTSKPVTLVPSSVPPKNELSGKRKTVPLPQRLPGQTRNSRRDPTPSDCSSTSSSPRMFSTDSKSRSYSSSVSSLSSPSDVASIQELPLVRVSMSPTA